MVKRQSTNVNAGIVASTNLPFVNPVLGNSALYCVVHNGGATPPSSVTDSLGQIYALDAVQAQGTGNFVLSIWSTTNSNAGVITLTVTLNSPQTLRVAILEYGGMALTGLADGSTGSQINGVTTVASGNFATTQNDELLLCVFGNASGATMLADVNFTQQEVVSAGANNGQLQVADRLVNIIGVYNATPSQNTVGNLAVFVASYRGLVIVTDGFTGFGSRFLGHFTEVA